MNDDKHNSSIVVGKLIKKHGCPTCRDIADLLIEIGHDLMQNGDRLVGMGDGAEGRARIHAGMAVCDVGEILAMDSANTTMSAALLELEEIGERIESALVEAAKSNKILNAK